MVVRPAVAGKSRKTTTTSRKQLPAGKTPAKSLMAAKKRPSETGRILFLTILRCNGQNPKISSRHSRFERNSALSKDDRFANSQVAFCQIGIF
jgi:hypothetical protein